VKPSFELSPLLDILELAFKEDTRVFLGAERFLIQGNTLIHSYWSKFDEKSDD
jgi:hypothetical protein